mmetsp:Transcript_21027/g.34308  ORF Transcript_21027/g.34308 Transcript_21027/m.34308 type:complete len:264 (+) Transcript_21027:1737-2528(+)
MGSIESKENDGAISKETSRTIGKGDESHVATSLINGGNRSQGKSQVHKKGEYDKGLVAKIVLYMVCCECVCCRRVDKDKQLKPVRERRILCIGNSGAGKTTLLERIHNVSIGKPGKAIAPVEPTNGFSVKEIRSKNANLAVWDIGGAERLQKYWGKYLDRVESIMFVMDVKSCDEPSTFDAEISCLKKFLRENYVTKHMPVVLLINKVDDTDSCKLDTDILLERATDGLDSFAPYRFQVFLVSALPNKEPRQDLTNALEWLST